MPPIKRLNVVDYIVEEMLTRIRSGEFKKGEKIPPEKVLTKEFGVSRTSLREAFKKLELLGLITILSQTPWKLKMTAPNNTDRMSYGTKLSND